MKKPLLRTIALSCVFCLTSFVSKAQWVSIPDTNFGMWLNSHYYTCLQGDNTVGWQMDTTCSAIVGAFSIYIHDDVISNIAGIEYFDSLQFLSCWNLPLTALPTLPNSIVYLDCSSNQLSSLSALPTSLVTLWCDYNQLTSVPALPIKLEVFHCEHNQLNSLPDLPNTLTTLACQFNDLGAIPELPDSLNGFDCSYNPNLACLPLLKKVNWIDYSNTSINCLLNYPQSNTYSQPPLDSIPLCDIFNPNGCSAFFNIKGKLYRDTNMNCLYDAGENTCKNLKVFLYENGILQQQTNTFSNGEYSFATTFSSYQCSVDTTNLPFTLACPDSGYYTSIITPLDSFDNDRNFGFRCNPGFDLVAWSIVPSHNVFVPTITTRLVAEAGDISNFYGTHCAFGINGSVQLVMSGPVTYISPAIGALIPTSISGDTVTWNIADFGTINFFTDFNIMVQTDTTAQIGQLVCFSLVVTPIAGDNNPSNNALDYCSLVVASYDPNEKEVYPAGNIDTAQKWLTYTIHFQNTGTAEAQHIYVTDTLDANVDASSFQLLAYSHQPMVQIKDNAVRFNFPNINLPDSNTNEPLSHGYVQYKVKLKDNLPIGTNISNTAFIYFDFNSPVVTNTTSNTITTATGIKDLGLRILDFGLNPNPASASFAINVDESMIGSGLTVYDVTGRELLHSAVQIRNQQFEIRNFPKGVYIVEIKTKEGSLTKKLVKM